MPRLKVWSEYGILNSEITYSFPVTPWGRVPVNFNCATGGTCHQVVPVAQIEALKFITAQSQRLRRKSTKSKLLTCIGSHYLHICALVGLL